MTRVSRGSVHRQNVASTGPVGPVPRPSDERLPASRSRFQTDTTMIGHGHDRWGTRGRERLPDPGECLRFDVAAHPDLPRGARGDLRDPGGHRRARMAASHRRRRLLARHGVHLAIDEPGHGHDVRGLLRQSWWPSTYRGPTSRRSSRGARASDSDFGRHRSSGAVRRPPSVWSSSTCSGGSGPRRWRSRPGWPSMCATIRRRYAPSLHPPPSPDCRGRPPPSPGSVAPGRSAGR